MRPSPRRQSGVALITALLIVALATVISVRISSRLQLDVRRTANLISLDQAAQYARAAEDWSARILRQDRKDNKHDSLDEPWAIALPPIPVEGGSIQGALSDYNACLNLNALINDKGEIDELLKTRLQRLLHNLPRKDDATAPPSIQALLDWIDADLQRRNPDGAEDSYYLNLEQPYRAANQPLQSLSELRLIKGYDDPQLLAQLAGSLCVYPPAPGAATVNVNTAGKEVLKSLADGITDGIADAIIEQRSEEPFTDIKDFLAMSQIKKLIKDANGLSVSSSTFLLKTRASIGPARLVVYSILRRDDAGNVSVISRSRRTL